MSVWAIWMFRMINVTLVDTFQGHHGRLGHYEAHTHQFEMCHIFWSYKWIFQYGVYLLLKYFYNFVLAKAVASLMKHSPLLKMAALCWIDFCLQMQRGAVLCCLEPHLTHSSYHPVPVKGQTLGLYSRCLCPGKGVLMHLGISCMCPTSLCFWQILKHSIPQPFCLYRCEFP